MCNKKLELTEEGERYMDSLYGKTIEYSKDWFVGISKELMITALNYAGTCDEAYPDHAFLDGIKWERKRQRKLKKVPYLNSSAKEKKQ